MKIIVAGMRRCGSTLLYNIIRLSYLEFGCKVKGFLWDADDFSEPPDYSEFDIQVMKRHQLPHQTLTQWADKIFLPVRDLRDIIASDIRFGHINRDTQSILDDCNFNIVSLNEWKKYSNLIYIYEEYVHNPLLYIDKVHQDLEIRLDDIEQFHQGVVRFSNQEISNPATGFDKESLLFPNHITSGGRIGSYKEFLTADEIALIEDNYQEFLTEYG